MKRLRNRLHKIKSALSAERKALDRIRKTLANIRATERELNEADDALLVLIGRYRMARQRLRDKPWYRRWWSEAKRERKREELADKIEAALAETDKITERLARLEKREAKTERKLAARKDTVERLAKRRAAIERALKDAHDKLRLTRNFTRPEFDCREGPPVPDYMHDDLERLCQKFLEPMRSRFGAAHVNSGHRWRFYNVKIGGAVGSYHEYEIRQKYPAADLTFARGTPAEWAAYARELADRHGIGGVGQYSSFVHVDTGPRRNWWG
jgi:uncharacterized protein YcbK (DUF882 family)